MASKRIVPLRLVLRVTCQGTMTGFLEKDSPTRWLMLGKRLRHACHNVGERL